MAQHEELCVHPKKTGLEVMGAVVQQDVHAEEEKKLYSDIFSLLSYEKITFNGIGSNSYYLHLGCDQKAYHIYCFFLSFVSDFLQGS